MLNTENAGGLAGSGVAVNDAKNVEFLIGTFVESVGRDVKEGEVIEISTGDYRFLKAYDYVKDAITVQPAITANAGVSADETSRTQRTGRNR